MTGSLRRFRESWLGGGTGTRYGWAKRRQKMWGTLLMKVGWAPRNAGTRDREFEEQGGMSYSAWRPTVYCEVPKHYDCPSGGESKNVEGLYSGVSQDALLIGACGRVEISVVK